jgi:hypothetical protein
VADTNWGPVGADTLRGIEAELEAFTGDEANSTIGPLGVGEILKSFESPGRGLDANTTGPEENFCIGNCGDIGAETE